MLSFGELLITVTLLLININHGIYGINGQITLLDTIDVLREIVDELPHDPDFEITPIQRIRRHGYPAEEHVFITEDGYILTAFRIPCGINCPQGGRGKGQPVLLVHGFFCSAGVFLINGPGRALGYQLADAGYDVWLMNSRGSSFSEGHIELSTYPQSSYWNFSFHEMGLYDVSAHIDGIYDIKRQECSTSINPNDMIIITHSMGATQLYVLLSERPEYNARVRAVFNLAPVGYRTSTVGLLRIVEMLVTRNTEPLFWLLGADRLGSNIAVLRSIIAVFCSIPGIPIFLCENGIYIVGGYNPEQLNRTLVPLMLNTIPEQSSSKTAIHVSQLERTDGKLRQFDYGTRHNLLVYGQPIPPEYDLSKITAPIATYYGTKDFLAPAVDVISFEKNLRNSIGIFEYPFQHLDFTFGIDAYRTVNSDVMRCMKQFQ